MKFVPHEYQERAIRQVIEQHKIGLFLDMGLGKTVITLTAIRDLVYDYFSVRQVLVIAPKRVAEDTWSREHEKWDHLKDLRISLVTGSPKERQQALKADADVYVIGRDNVTWLIDLLGPLFSSVFDMVVLDELSSFKNPQAKRFRALKKYIFGVSRVVGLTGTPSPNGLLDLWSEIYLLDQGYRLGRTLTAYRSGYFTPGARNGSVVYEWRPAPGAREAIEQKLSDLCISMSAKDYLQLPERIDNIVPVRLSGKELASYKKMEQEQLLAYDKETVTAMNAAAVTNKLLQIANGSVYSDDKTVLKIHDKKLEALKEIIDTVQEPVLVFYSYRHDLATISTELTEARELKGPEDIKAWNEGSIKVLLAHPASVGYGLNLQAGGHIIIWYGLTWSLELYQQANARLYRQGQSKPVIIHHLIAEGTYDERVLKVLQGKETLQTALLTALKERGK